MTTIPGVGPQLAKAAAGVDPRGWLCFEHLPPDLQRQEDATQAHDHALAVIKHMARGYERPATPAERTLLTHLGYVLPDELVTVVRYPTTGVRNRQWPALADQHPIPLEETTP